jgi:alpha-beta hydrolase superfamily lysophospholipase
MKLLVRALLILAIVYAGMVGFVAARQDRFLYQPIHESEASLLKLATGSHMQPLRNEGGEVAAWHLSNPTAARRLIVFHGGAGHALHRHYYAEGFHRLGWDVCIFEYPGFGARSGSPGKESFFSAARSFITAEIARDARPTFLLGESMGSGTVCAIAGTMPEHIAGLALIVPYGRLAEVAKHHLPYIPIDLILRDRYDNIAALANYRRPVTVVVAADDEVVTADQGRKLHAAYQGPKNLITLPNCKHAGFPTEPDAEWWRKVSETLAH